MKFIYRNYIKFFYKKTCHYNDFFYPQDNIPSYNTIYGKQGFMVSQFLIPEKKFKKILNEISEYFNENKIFYDFVILKKFKENGKYLNFSGSGYSISFTFVIDKKYDLLKKFLNNIFAKYNLKIDLAKDSILSKISPQSFRFHGIASIPAERYIYGLAGDLSVMENFSISQIDHQDYGTPYWINNNSMFDKTNKIIKDFNILGAFPNTKARILSGGNAQKQNVSSASLREHFSD